MSDDLPKKIRIWPRLIIYPLILVLVILVIDPFPGPHVP
jgi:hypothetical protein